MLWGRKIFTCEYASAKRENQWRNPNQEYRSNRHIDCRTTTKTFDDIKSVSLDNVVWDMLGKTMIWKARDARKAMYMRGTPKHKADSTIWRQRFLECVRLRSRMAATRSRCMQRLNMAAGSATVLPTSSLVAVEGWAKKQYRRRAAYWCHTIQEQYFEQYFPRG